MLAVGNTYVQTLENATLEWRIDMARLVLRMELLCQGRLDTRAGISEDNTATARDAHHYYIFRQVTGGKRDDDGTDIFSVPRKETDKNGGDDFLSDAQKRRSSLTSNAYRTSKVSGASISHHGKGESIAIRGINYLRPPAVSRPSRASADNDGVLLSGVVSGRV
jgi:hypothetical protein